MIALRGERRDRRGMLPFFLLWMLKIASGTLASKLSISSIRVGVLWPFKKRECFSLRPLR